ncbi:ATP-dependent nuclease [Streptoalloteichus hindustanus]|uniref:Putative ATP-dependent endonuclease of the OLD family n=1 Tax=Streptoalloteichus hindustanus TaxID=2017 RepID=A0A1M5I655_STRHI|nr:AAA family ATPase [Streptoalloteichus hindustanus]SHG23805.1 putative ATP-dependent endonuclease of the OLD family [Streptoalloteichus hindustanus]
MHLSRLLVRGLRASAEHDLEVRFPGRFAVLVGANGSGKTTVAEALQLVHTKVFPRLSSPTAAALGDGERSVKVEWTYAHKDTDESPLGIRMQTQNRQSTPGATAISWVRELSRYLGRVVSRSQSPSNDLTDSFRLVYLPATRNPIDELARREARILVELLRAQRQNAGGGRDLADLRARASALLEQLVADGLIQAVEQRIAGHLQSLSAGVSRNWPYVGGQVIDDAYLARVLELMLAVLEGRQHARPLEVSGLGYVNLLHIAVTLAAIPDQRLANAAARARTEATARDSAEGDPPATGEAVELDPAEVVEAEARLREARAERESEEDSFFPSQPLHVTVLIEEPEAHLHPQLQHSLARYLQRIVRQRPELQIILSSHATDIITSCDPEQIVVLRRDRDGRPVCRSVAGLDIPDRAEVVRKTRLHLDASRSAALFAERLLLVEGVTDAALVREFGWAWAGEDVDKQSFIDALSIVPMGTKVGSWAVRLLATRGHELCDRLAVLRDSDKAFEDSPTPPTWLTEDAHDPRVVVVEYSHPTLEPSITPGNESHIRAALEELGIEVPDPLDAAAVHELFRSARRATEERDKTPAGPAATRKGEFALALASHLAEQRYEGNLDVSLPGHMRRVFDFLHAGESVPDPEMSGTGSPDEPVAERVE